MPLCLGVIPLKATRKAKLLDISGAVISFAAPAAAAVSELPYTVREVTGGEKLSFLDILHLSSAAFAIVCILAAITMWRFFANRVKTPKSGLLVSGVGFAICYGVEQFIHILTVVLLWATIGCAVASVCYYASDQIRAKEGLSVV